MSKSDKSPVLIFYGSQTGTAEAYGRMLGTYAASHGFEPIVSSMNDGITVVKEGKAKSAAAVLFVTSTYGTGEFPSNAETFYKELTAGNLNSLAATPFAILGLGNSKNEQYNAAAKKLEVELVKIGMKSVLPTKLSCELQPNGHDAVFRVWKRSVWAALGCSSVGVLAATYAIESATAANKITAPNGFVEAKVSKNDLLTPEGYQPMSRLMTVSIPTETQKTMIGRTATSNEHLEIIPLASKTLVDRALARLNLKGDVAFTIKPLPGAPASHFDNTSLTAADILRSLVDISSIPTRSFLEALAFVATDADDKTKLQDFADDLGVNSEYDKLARGVFSIVDLLEMFPKLNVDLAQLLTHAPHNKQRTYSIANDIQSATDAIEFCYTVPIRVADNRQHEGLCAGMLNSMEADASILVRVVTGPATKPKNANNVVFIALGSGIATVRATLQQRQAAKARGETVGDAKLFYGFRNAGKNDIFRAEMEEFEKAGFMSKIHFVGSNDQPEFRVPMMEMDASLVDFLGDAGELMYCGLGGSVPVVVEGHMRRVGIDVTAFRLGGRYHEEYFTPDLDMENLLKDHGAGDQASTLAARMGKCDMFCFQCEQTFKNKGCSKVGVCGKTPEVAALQDLTIHAAKTLGFYLHESRAMGGAEQDELNRLTLYALFTTLTNVNFDAARFVKVLTDMKAACSKARVGYEKLCKAKGVTPVKKAAITVPSADGGDMGDIEALVDQGKNVGVLSRFVNPDTQSAAGVTEMLVYGLKGIAAYTDHSLMNNHENAEVYEFIHRALHLMAGEESFDLGKGLGMCLEAGKVNVTSMSMLYNSNKTLGVPTITTVPNAPRAGKCILVSGHDLIILKGLLEVTEPLGINVYTHGEMLPGHSYPELHKFKNLAGNFGGAWMRQSIEFPHFPGPILMTTNCLTEPHESYAARIFTAGAVGWKGVPHVGDNMTNIKFDEVVAAAQQAKGFSESDSYYTYSDPIGVKRPLNYTIGFGHETILSVAPTIVEEIGKGNITRFFLVGGCDGFEGQRSYYTDLVSKLPKTAVVLTVGCGKYRFNHLNLGTIGDTGIPRILDMGQCNDSFSAVQVALALADVLKCQVSDLPLSIVLSWFEQKAIAVLLSCLHLGLKPIYVGPSLPAFITQDVLGVLVKDFGIRVCGDPAADLEVMINAKGMGWEAPAPAAAE